MRQETNNEIDLLLRRLSRRQDASDLHADGDHLDADELSSYAENALPAAARARYTEHLTECASCRGLVVKLSASVDLARLEETSKVSESSGLRKFLASLFSPMVLRYAVPALGLIVVAAIGFAVLRKEERAADFMAQVEQEGRIQAPPASSQQPAPPPADQSFERQEKFGSASATPEAPANRSKETQRADTNAAAPAGTAGNVRQDAPTDKTEQQPIANEPPPRPAPKLAAATDESQKRVEAEARKQAIQDRVAPASEVSRERASEPARGEDRKSEDVTGARATSAKSKAQGAGSIAKIQRDGLEEKDKDDAETRSVAGRRFRKERGTWIDTAYDSSGSTVNLKRGSEQYRALVADEPAIKTIAEQLDGEIIVVWKGRAYRIR